MSNFPLNEFLRYLKHIRRYSSHTLIAYRTDLLQFKHFYKRNLFSIKLRNVVEWIIDLKEGGYTERSINRKIEVLKSFYRYHFKRGNCCQKHIYAIPKLRYTRKKFIPITENELLCVLSNLDKTENRKTHRDILIIELLYVTGCRVHELTNIKRCSVDYANKRIKVVGKGNKERYLLVTEKLMIRINRNLKLWKGKNKGHYLICDNRGKKVYPMLIDRVIKKYFKPSPELQRSAHIIRHSMATHLYNHGVKLDDIQKILGHVFKSSTAQYIYIDNEILLKIYRNAHPKP